MSLWGEKKFDPFDNNRKLLLKYLVARARLSLLQVPVLFRKRYY